MPLRMRSTNEWRTGSLAVLSVSAWTTGAGRFWVEVMEEMGAIAGVAAVASMARDVDQRFGRVGLLG